MKRTLVALSVLLGISLGMIFANSPSAFADNPLTNVCNGAGSNSSICKSQDNTSGNNPITGKNGILTKTASILAYIAGVTAVIVIITGGAMYVTANGDTGRASTARNMIIFALGGLVIIVLARSIVIFIINRV